MQKLLHKDSFDESVIEFERMTEKSLNFSKTLNEESSKLLLGISHLFDNHDDELKNKLANPLDYDGEYLNQVISKIDEVMGKIEKIKSIL